ncbi:hypothetical protein Tco_1092828 [Tanacetum coccineum]|uniref:Uncharacterized protein n=1 Tax=Tanacetum coccineum TaxID=301880 RepID=A0ABQ5IB00_9ASTR
MATMAENVIAVGKENGEMLKDSIKNGPYQFMSKMTVKDTYGVTDIRRAQRLKDLARDDKLRYDTNIKAINILLLGLPVDIYTLINYYQTEKEIGDRIKELMEGTEMTKQERESMLYDEFDKFPSEPRESIHSYILRFAKLINDMNMIPMSMTPMQINTKFLFAFLKHNERDAKEVREMRQRFPEPLALLANTYNPLPSYISNQTYYAPTVVQQTPTFQPDTRLAIPTFLPTDDPIASLNKAMIFLSSLYCLKFPPTNNQLRTSSNPRTQTTIQNSQVTVKSVQGRHSQGYAGNAGNTQASGARCTAKKWVKDSEWFKDKMLLDQVKEAGVVLDEEQEDFLTNNLEETNDCEDL